MSFNAMAWAIKQDTKHTTSKFILLVLASYSDENDGSFPSYSHIAEICCCSEETAMKGVKKLVELGFIKKENRFTQDGKQTSNRYILNRGLQKEGVGVLKSIPNTIRYNNNNNTPKNYSPQFLEWWDIYPRKDGSKAKAFESYSKLLSKNIIDENILLEKTKIYRNNNISKQKQYLPHATTWLNQRYFETVEEQRTTNNNRNTLAG